MHKLKKQPGETLVGVSIDFAARLAVGETVSTGTAIASLMTGTGSEYGAEPDPNTNTLTSTDVSVDGTKVLATISKGYTGCIYKVTYTANGSLGNVLESEIKVTVKEV